MTAPNTTATLRVLVCCNGEREDVGRDGAGSGEGGGQVTHSQESARAEWLRVNARAEDIIRAIVRIKNKAAWYALRVNRLQYAQQYMRDPERKMVCDIIANGSTEFPNTPSQPRDAAPTMMEPQS